MMKLILRWRIVDVIGALEGRKYHTAGAGKLFLEC